MPKEYESFSNSKKLFFIIGLVVFGGMFLTSVIDGEYYAGKGQLLEYRLFILGSAFIYYVLGYFLIRKGGVRD